MNQFKIKDPKVKLKKVFQSAFRDSQFEIVQA